MNHNKLYHRICDLSKKNIISNYSQDKPYIVYHQSEWFSDRWDPMDYGRDFDFSRPFFEQYKELFESVPRIGLDQGVNMENSDFNNYADDLKDCYMNSDTIGSRSCYYNSSVFGSEDCVDCCYMNDSRECYECLSCKNCHGLQFSRNSENCNNSAFLKDCNGCDNCFCSVNLTNKQYHIFNTPYSKTNYEKKKQELLKQKSRGSLEIDFQDFIRKNPLKYANIVGSENVSGDYLFNSRNCKSSYVLNNADNVAYSYIASNAHDCHDCEAEVGVSWSYNTLVTGGNSSNCLFSIAGWENCKYLIYSDYCFF